MKRISGFLFMAAVAFSFFGCGDPGSESVPDDRATAIPVVEAYLRALSERDRDEIMALSIPADQKDERGVLNRIEKYGGIDPKQAKITMAEGITPWVPVAVIEVERGDSSLLRWTETLYWDEDKWLFLLSAREGDGPDPPVSGPEYTGPDPTSGPIED